MDYRLSDLLMFSADTYFRLFERANGLWPLALLLGFALLAGMWRRRRVLALPAAALACLIVAWWFHHRLYASINLAGDVFAAGFATQALLILALFAPVVPSARMSARAALPGRMLVIYALFVHPLLWILAGRDWRATELFAIAPDPTALATLGLALASPLPFRWFAVPLPLLWCLMSGLTYLAMDRPVGLLLPVAALFAVGLHGWLLRPRVATAA